MPADPVRSSHSERAPCGPVSERSERVLGEEKGQSESNVLPQLWVGESLTLWCRVLLD